MKKNQPIKHSALYIGQLVVVTEYLETQVYTVADVREQIAILQWYEGENFCSCGHDKFGLMKPTLEQIEYSIANNGPLVSSQEVLDWA